MAKPGKQVGRREWQPALRGESVQSIGDARPAVEEELARPEFAPLPEPPRLHVAAAPLTTAVARLIQEEQIDLLVMETKSRLGFRGLFVSNPIERVLPRVACSVLAVKPYGSACPVPLESPAVQAVPFTRVVTRPAALG